MLVNERLFRLTESSWKSRERRERPSSVSPTKHAFSLDCIDSNLERGGTEEGQDRKGLPQTAGIDVRSVDTF